MQDPEKKRPNLFVVGAMKAGTTTMYKVLKQHPDIYMSPVKEPHFFSSDIDAGQFSPEHRPDGFNAEKYCRQKQMPEVHSAYITRWEDYMGLFKNVVRQTVIGEASSSYLYSKRAASNIRAASPDARIIIILRDPVERAYSHFRMDLAIGRVCGSFRDAVEADHNRPVKGWGISGLYVELSLYYEQVKRFLDVFPKNQVLILLSEDLKIHEPCFRDKISRFLDIDGGEFPLGNDRYNRAMTPRFTGLNHLLHKYHLKSLIRSVCPQSVIELGKRGFYEAKRGEKISGSDVRFLMQIFKDDIDQLSYLIDKDLSFWKKEPAKA